MAHQNPQPAHPADHGLANGLLLGYGLDAADRAGVRSGRG